MSERNVMITFAALVIAVVATFGYFSTQQLTLAKAHTAQVVTK